ncbi:MAG: hypothetical protein ACTSU2_07080 [Promethearchaeota archaeon]
MSESESQAILDELIQKFEKDNKIKYAKIILKLVFSFGAIMIGLILFKISMNISNNNDGFLVLVQRGSFLFIIGPFIIIYDCINDLLIIKNYRNLKEKLSRIFNFQASEDRTPINSLYIKSKYHILERRKNNIIIKINKSEKFYMMVAMTLVVVLVSVVFWPFGVPNSPNYTSLNLIKFLGPIIIILLIFLWFLFLFVALKVSLENELKVLNADRDYIVYSKKRNEAQVMGIFDAYKSFKDFITKNKLELQEVKVKLFNERPANSAGRRSIEKEIREDKGDEGVDKKEDEPAEENEKGQLSDGENEIIIRNYTREWEKDSPLSDLVIIKRENLKNIEIKNAYYKELLIPLEECAGDIKYFNNLKNPHNDRASLMKIDDLVLLDIFTMYLNEFASTGKYLMK